VARYWSIAAVPLSTHPSPLVITTKLAAAIYGGALYGGGALLAQYYPCAPLPSQQSQGCQWKKNRTKKGEKDRRRRDGKKQGTTKYGQDRRERTVM